MDTDSFHISCSKILLVSVFSANKFSSEKGSLIGFSSQRMSFHKAFLVFYKEGNVKLFGFSVLTTSRSAVLGISAAYEAIME